MDVIQAIKERRSVRKYRPDPIPEEVLKTVLEAARWAPSWSNTQCTRYVVVKDSDTKAKVAEALLWHSPTGSNPATEAVRHAPMVVVACAQTGRSGFYKGEAKTDKGDWFMFDVGIAMENLALAAHSLGLGTVHVGLFDAKKVGEILQVPEGVRVVELTPLGYPEGPTQGPGRKEWNEIVFYEKYGHTSHTI
jgi:nitroreductase